MGNVRDDAEFFGHFDFLVAELARVMKPGRNVSFPLHGLASVERTRRVHRAEGLSGELLRAFQRRGFIFHAKATIWKDPVTAMQRTKALGLLHKSVRERRHVPPRHLTTSSRCASRRV